MGLRAVEISSEDGGRPVERNRGLGARRSFLDNETMWLNVANIAVC